MQRRPSRRFPDSGGGGEWHRAGLDDDPQRVFALERALLTRIVVALALVVAAVTVKGLAAPYINPVVVTGVAVFSCAAGAATAAAVLVRYWGWERHSVFVIVDLVVGLAAVLDALVLLTPSMWR